MDAFDADVLIYAAAPGHPLGERVAALFPATAAPRLADKARYKLGLADATHLATAIRMGARRFITANSRDFGKSIKEIEVTYPADLPDPAERA